MSIVAADRGLPSLTYSEAGEDLRGALRSLLQQRSDWPAVLARTETSETYDTGLWQVLAAEVGCAGLLIPESDGGAGAGYQEMAVVAEEAGRAVAPVPYLGSAVLATAAALSAGDARAARRPGLRRADRHAGRALRHPAGPGRVRGPARRGPGGEPRAGRPGWPDPAVRHRDRGGRCAARLGPAGARGRGPGRAVRGAGRCAGPDRDPGGVAGPDPPAGRPVAGPGARAVAGDRPRRPRRPWPPPWPPGRPCSPPSSSAWPSGASS